MKCPDCTDGKYRPLMGAAEDCATCKGTQEVSDSGGVPSPPPSLRVPSLAKLLVPGELKYEVPKHWNPSAYVKLNQRTGEFDWEENNRTEVSLKSLKDVIPLEVIRLELDVGHGMQYESNLYLCETGAAWASVMLHGKKLKINVSRRDFHTNHMERLFHGQSLNMKPLYCNTPKYQWYAKQIEKFGP